MFIPNNEAPTIEPHNATRVAVRIFQPRAELRGYVTFFYCVDAARPLMDFLYPEWGNVRFAISGDWMVRMPKFQNEAPQTAVLFGPTDRHGSIQTSGGKTVGFGLTPIGWARLIGGNAAEIANRVEPVANRLGIDGEIVRAALTGLDDAATVQFLELLLIDLAALRAPVDEIVLATDRALRNRPPTVGEFAAGVGCSTRTLHRICLRAFGFSPKRLMRLQRFLDTLGQVRTAVGSSVRSALDEDYCDQSHFYRDFKEFMAMTPRQYFSAPRQLMGAAAEAQTRAGVTLSFRLPPQPTELAEAPDATESVSNRDKLFGR